MTSLVFQEGWRKSDPSEERPVGGATFDHRKNTKKMPKQSLCSKAKGDPVCMPKDRPSLSVGVGSQQRAITTRKKVGGGEG